ncbi:MAG: sigma-54-dependent transcriptional regulator [Nitrospirae bacterium]|nr:MAG: sigma-54-dependent transcriptional regulator [Nitrospirota bacterium]
MKPGASNLQGLSIEILDYTTDGIIAVDHEGIVVFMNSAAERITGLSRDSVIGRDVVQAIPNTRLNIVVKTGIPEIDKKQLIGDTVILTSRYPIRDASGEIRGAVAIFKDITEIEELSDRVSDLWHARELLEAVIEASEDAISVADERGRNIIVNPAYTRITGLPKEAVINQPVTVDIAEGESMHMKVLKTGKPVHNVRMKVGPLKKEVLVNVAPIYIDGEIRGSVGVIHDISEILSLTEELTKAKKLIRQLEAKYTFDDIIGSSPHIVKAKEEARRAAATPVTVLLLGESGTGKELFAHAIHNSSFRKGGQFIRVNCASLSENLLESELFGYEEGAFTGAKRGGKKGLFEEADGGTIFLDEIAELPLTLQSKLLRVMTEREIRRVGGTEQIPIDVRIIAATNADLEKRVRDGGFREDLFFRLNVFPIRIVPLRMRKDDIPSLVEHIVYRLNQAYGKNVRGASEDVLYLLREYDWPGNIRELENVIGRAMINMKPNEVVVEPEHLPPLCQDQDECFEQVFRGRVRSLDEVVSMAEKEAIMNALKASGGNREGAAKLLGISLRSLYYKINRYGIRDTERSRP